MTRISHVAQAGSLDEAALGVPARIVRRQLATATPMP